MSTIDQLKLRDVAGGVVLAVKAVPGSSRDKIVGILGDTLKIATAAAPEKGKANKAVTGLLAKALDLNTKNIELISGPSRPRKEFLIRGIAPEELRQKLEECL